MENKRATEELITLVKRGRTRSGAVAVPSETGDAYPMHLRIAFSTANEYLACLLHDTRFSDGRWEVRPEYPFHLTVRIRKTPAMVRLVEEQHAITATDIVRVLALPDAEGKYRKSRKLSGLQKHIKEEDGSERRFPKQQKCFVENYMTISFSSLDRVSTVDNDMDKMYKLAADTFPPSDGVVGLAHALSVGLMMPRNEDTLAGCLAKLGISSPEDVAFFERTESPARLATDPRFSALLSTPRAQFTNIRARNILDRARDWVVDTVLLPPCAKTEALDGMSLPVLLKPTPTTPTGPRGNYKLREAQTGIYGPQADRRGNMPRAFVQRTGGTSLVVGYVFNLAFTPGSDAMPRGEDIASYQWYPPHLSVADTFVTRLEAASFDGDVAWGSADIRRALGLAKRVQWAFRDPDGASARELYERVQGVI